jgi:hypothetical protein
VDLEEMLGVARKISGHQLPYGHLYDALRACGCEASAGQRKQHLGHEFGMLAGVPEENREGGRGNVGLKVTVVSVKMLPQQRSL